MEQDRTAEYLSSLEPEQDVLLRDLRTYAETHDVPIVRLETESFLRTLAAAKQPGRILEIGTAIGYSTIVLAGAAGFRKNAEASAESGSGAALKKQEAAGGDAAAGRCLLTIESWERRIPLAKENLARAGLSETVRLIHGDAGAVLKELLSDGAYDRTQGRGFDFVFLDAAKGQYVRWLPDILSLMNDGALLVADNVLQDNTVLQSRFTVPRRERTTHARMREFLYEIKHHALLESAVLPLGDGVSLSVRRKDGLEAE